MRILQIILIIFLLFSGFELYASDNINKFRNIYNNNNNNIIKLFLSKEAKSCEKSCDNKKEYLFVFSADKLEIKKVSNNNFNIIITNPYPNAMFFSNGKIPKKGGLYTIPFFKKIQKELKKHKTQVQLKMRLYPGTSWQHLLAKAMHVKLNSIDQQKNKNKNKDIWIFNISPENDNTILAGQYIYPDFFIFNSDLPQGLY